MTAQLVNAFLPIFTQLICLPVICKEAYMLFNYALAAVITDCPYVPLKSVFMTSTMRIMMMALFPPLSDECTGLLFPEWVWAHI